jgi:hypothetical protein
MFSTLMVRVQTRAAARAIASPAGPDGPPATRYYGENRSGESGGFKGVIPPR